MNSSTTRLLRAFATTTLGLAILAGCGGGGSDAPAPVADTTLPTLTSPMTASELVVQRSRITVQGTASDDVGVASVTLDVGGTAAPVTFSGGNFSATIDLKPGRNAYTVTATDAAGNRRQLSGSVYLGHRVTGGNSHSGAIVNGKLYTWGRNNFGQTGLGFTSAIAANPATHPAAPTLVNSSAEFVSLAFNQNHSVALDASGKLWSWGTDSDGQLGRGTAGRSSCGTGSSATNNCRLDVAEVPGLANVVLVSAGYNHVLALRNDGTVWGFGLNDLGQLGDGTTTASSSPVQVQWATADAAVVGRIVQVAASSKSSYALDDKGQVWAWGRNQYANLGQGSVSTSTSAQSVPLLVPMPSGVRITSVAVGRDHVLALASDGKVYAWGLNASSQVGFNGRLHAGQPTAWPSPVLSPRSLPAMETSPAVEVYANGTTSYVRRADGKLYPWGAYGATAGTGGTIYADLDEPEDRLPTLLNMTDLGVGALHQIALRQDGVLFSWGWSFEGSLGGGATTTNIWMYNVPLTPVLP